MSRTRKFYFCCCAGFIVTMMPLAAGDTGDAGFVAGSAIPIVPMTGDGLQMFSPAYKPNYARICPEGTVVEDCTHTGAPNRTLTDAGVQGADEGSTATSPDGIPIFLFGDTNLVWRDNDSGRLIFYNRTFRGPDAIGYFDHDAAQLDWSKCNYMENLSAALTAGKDPKTASAANCPALSFYTRSGSTPPPRAIFQNEDRLKGLHKSMDGLRENYGPIATPTGAFFLNGYLYEFYQDMPEIRRDRQRCKPFLHLNTILAKSTSRYPDWTKASSLTFEKLYDASQHPVVKNCADPEDTQAQDPGKFIFAAPVVLDQATVKSLGVIDALPEKIRGARQFIFIFGSSWYYRASNVYLAVVADSDIDNGPSKWWYLTAFEKGSPKWQQGSDSADSNKAEISAQPLFTTWSNRMKAPIVGEHSVRYIKELGAFVLLYGKPAAGGLFARTAKLPWGPWSPEVNIFQSAGEWASRISRRGPGNPITQNWPAIFDGPRAGRHAFDDFGAGPYGPNIIENKYTVNQDGTVTIYYTTSFFVPYQVFLMKATFAKR